MKLEKSLEEALDGMTAEYQCKLAHLLSVCNELGAYGDDFGELAVISKSGTIMMREADAAPLYVSP